MEDKKTQKIKKIVIGNENCFDFLPSNLSPPKPFNFYLDEEINSLRK